MTVQLDRIYETDSSGYSESIGKYGFGKNVQGFLVHLVPWEVYNRTALCGTNVEAVSGGAFFPPYGRSHLCRKCLTAEAEL